MSDNTITIAMTGASGAVYGLRLLQECIKANKSVYFLISEPGQIVVSMETELTLPKRSADMQKILTEYAGAQPDQITVFGQNQWTAPIASGSSSTEAMVVCPCTTGTLSAIATGASRSLMERAADVMIKERKKLIIVPRESPFSEIHLENMLKLARMGVVILPPNPGFYQNPKTLDDVVDFVVGKILDQLDIQHDLVPLWGE